MSLNARQRARRTRQMEIVRAEPHAADDVALEVWASLSFAAHDGLALWEMGHVLPQYTPSQLRRGIDRINHVLQETREHPLVIVTVRGRGAVYRFAERPVEYRAFALRRMRELLTRSSTELARAEAALLRWPDDLAPYLPKMLVRLQEDMADVLGELASIEEGEEQ